MFFAAAGKAWIWKACICVNRMVVPGGTGVTLRLDLPQPGCPASVCKGKVDAVFQDASVDGSRVWFTDSQRLTATAGEGDLYECAITLGASGEPVCKLSDLRGGERRCGCERRRLLCLCCRVRPGCSVATTMTANLVRHEGWEAPRLVAPSP